MTPKWYELAKAELGTREAPGFANNPVVQQYYMDAGAGKNPDSVPWCAAFVGAMLKRAGLKGTGFLAARSYLNWGKESEPVQGAVVIFRRGNSAWQGHVAFVDAVTSKGVRVLGGNQADAVTYATYAKNRVLGYRWPTGKERK